MAGSRNGDLEAIRPGVRSLMPRPRTLVLDSGRDEDTLLRATEAGADGYLSGTSRLPCTRWHEASRWSRHA